MDTSKIVGYVLSLAGLAVIGLSNWIISKISFLSAIPKIGLYTVLAGFVLIAAGIALVLSGESSSNVKQAAAEVPIYEGTGKKRKIVGYQKAE